MLSVIARGHEVRPSLLQEHDEPAEDAAELVSLGTEPLYLRLQLQEPALGSRVGDDAGHFLRLVRRHAPSRQHDAQDAREEETDRQPEQPDPRIGEHDGQCTDSSREVKELREGKELREA
jgi:hypothetical protein